MCEEIAVIGNTGIGYCTSKHLPFDVYIGCTTCEYYDVTLEIALAEEVIKLQRRVKTLEDEHKNKMSSMQYTGVLH